MPRPDQAIRIAELENVLFQVDSFQRVGAYMIPTNVTVLQVIVRQA